MYVDQVEKRHNASRKNLKCVSPDLGSVGLQTFMTGFPNWDVMNVWYETTELVWKFSDQIVIVGLEYISFCDMVLLIMSGFM